MQGLCPKFIATHLPLQKNGWPAGSGFIRGVQPLRHKDVSEQFSLGGLLDTPVADVVFVVRNAVASEEDAAQLTRAQALNIPIVLDLDDALFDMAGHANEEAFKGTRPALISILRSANEVWTTTEYLRTRIIPYNENVYVIPNALDEELWQVSELDAMPSRRAEGVLRLLYMGSYTHCNDVLPILCALETLSKSGQIEVAIVGGMRPNEAPRWVRNITPPPGAALNYPSFVEWFIGLRGQFDLGLAPLRDNEFNRCKSSIKLLDYAGVGLPTICSNVGPYKDDDFPAFRVSGCREDWVELVDYLARHPKTIIEKRLLAIAELRRRGTLQCLSKQRLSRLNELIAFGRGPS